MTTMALFGCIATALRAAFSACWLIVVDRSAMFCGATTTAWLFATGWPLAVSIWTFRPGLPCPGGAPF